MLKGGRDTGGGGDTGETDVRCLGDELENGRLSFSYDNIAKGLEVRAVPIAGVIVLYDESGVSECGPVVWAA